MPTDIDAFLGKRLLDLARAMRTEHRLKAA